MTGLEGWTPEDIELMRKALTIVGAVHVEEGKTVADVRLLPELEHLEGAQDMAVGGLYLCLLMLEYWRQTFHADTTQVLQFLKSALDALSNGD